MRIDDISKLKSLIVILNRLIQVDGHIEIVRKRVPIGGEIMIEDMHGKFGLFKPIGVIHHSGEVIGSTTRGHYQADVLNKNSNQWFRTSDDEQPKLIAREEITHTQHPLLYEAASHPPRHCLCKGWRDSVSTIGWRESSNWDG